MNKAKFGKVNFVLKELKCGICGNKQIIPRRKNKNRSIGHIKHLWCYICKDLTAHCEINQIY